MLGCSGSKSGMHPRNYYSDRGRINVRNDYSKMPTKGLVPEESLL